MMFFKGTAISLNGPDVLLYEETVCPKWCFNSNLAQYQSWKSNFS